MSWSFRFRKRSEMPEGLWMRCDGCTKLVFKQTVVEQHNVCPECGHHFRLGAVERVALLADPESFVEFDRQIEGSDPLQFQAIKRYADKLVKARKVTGLRDAVVAGDATIGGHPVVLVVIDANFIQGSMGAAVGEKLARATERAIARMVPLLYVSGSGGGARMEEGAISLMQMAKTSAALARLHEAGGCYIAVLTHATMGGSMASWAMLGDLTIAEPKALLGFTGPRVIQNTIKKVLPEGFQRSEFLMERGFLDAIVPRGGLRDWIARALNYVVTDGRAGGWANEHKRRLAAAARELAAHANAIAAAVAPEPAVVMAVASTPSAKPPRARTPVKKKAAAKKTPTKQAPAKKAAPKKAPAKKKPSVKKKAAKAKSGRKAKQPKPASEP